jgi:PKD repeat protein
MDNNNRPPNTQSAEGFGTEPAPQKPQSEAKPQKETPSKTEQQTSKVPDPQAPSKPEPQAPSKPDPQAPSKPEPQAPSKPEPQVPSKPEPQAPSKPEPQVPSKPEPQVPSKAEPQAPSKPEPAPKPVDQSKPAVKPTAPATKTTGSKPAPKGAPAKPSQEQMIKKEKSRNKKLLFGCGGAFGCGTILLLVLIFVFVGAAGTGTSSLAQALGINQAQLVNTLILIVNLFFGISALIAFILSIGGIFKAVMARKADTITKKRGYVMSGSAFGILILIIVLWVGAWFYLNSQEVPEQEVQPTGLITTPEDTTNLTAPVEIKFDASNLPYDQNTYDILSYYWDFDDGTEGPGGAVETHVYETKGDGRFDVTLTLTFENVNTGEESEQTLEHTVTIADEQIRAIISADTTEGDIPLTVNFDGSESSDPDGRIDTYEWEVNGQGFEEGDETFTHTFERAGDHTVKLRVTNVEGDANVDEIDITAELGDVPNPVISIPDMEDNGQLFTDKSYSFDASGTTSPGGSITSYEWDFGDGTTKARTRNAQHTYDTAGTYTVILTVTDEAGVTATEEQQVKVSIAPSMPEAVIATVPAKEDPDDNFIEGQVPFEVSFDATNSTDPDDDIIDYQWDFDGDDEIDASGETVTYTFNEIGNYNVSLIVTDSAGFEDKSVLVVRAVSPGLQAELTADPVSGVVPLTVDFDATGSKYPDGEIVGYEWDFGDGSPRRSDIGQVTYKYTKIGNFTATVKVRTNDNKQEEAEALISVRQVPLKSCFEPSRTTGDAPLTVSLNPSCSTGTITDYDWNFGDGDTSTERRPTHTFENPGTYEIILEVSDAQNVVDTSSQFITVTGELTQ